MKQHLTQYLEERWPWEWIEATVMEAVHTGEYGDRARNSFAHMPNSRWKKWVSVWVTEDVLGSLSADYTRDAETHAYHEMNEEHQDTAGVF